MLSARSPDNRSAVKVLVGSDSSLSGEQIDGEDQCAAITLESELNRPNLQSTAWILKPNDGVIRPDCEKYPGKIISTKNWIRGLA